MNTLKPLLLILAGAQLGACALLTTADPEVIAAREKLTALQSDHALASRAPVAIREAEEAVRRAESADRDRAAHFAYIADRKVDIARAEAETALAEHHRQELLAVAERARLEARTREAERYRAQVADVRSEAERLRREAELARLEANQAQMQSEALRRQLHELNARQTERGMVVTLGDVLFATGSASLKGGPTANLDKLARFLKQYPDRTVEIEGHTDSIGSDPHNMALSQRRAESVKDFLIAQGVEPTRLRAVGRGETAPVSNNDTATGRQQNRRVEVIIENPPPAAP